MAMTAARKPAAGKKVPASKMPAAKGKAAKPTQGKAAKPTAVAKKAPPASKPRKITPAKALANTRALLEAKQAHDRRPQPWQALDPEQARLPQEGFQSPEAAARAEELHAGESRMPAIQGSISTRDRHDQGKRDGR